MAKIPKNLTELAHLTDMPMMLNKFKSMLGSVGIKPEQLLEIPSTGDPIADKMLEIDQLMQQVKIVDEQHNQLLRHLKDRLQELNQAIASYKTLQQPITLSQPAEPIKPAYAGPSIGSNETSAIDPMNPIHSSASQSKPTSPAD